ncbi:VQ motif-containing protein 11-like [Salvia miltiorrhiza]|uniref:VQ motif-containing protein 11-like n=1 Tax=Salvia miltiorrhiza TaxID=226208 RepID=UPI0025AC51F5|nr:VQ motif-containing protein 11-like [Salvia miltiorrhiza]
MASSPNNSSNPPIIHSLSNGLDPDTTFVQTDPETFRAVVQSLTGAGAERRPSARKLKIKLNGASNHRPVMASPVSPLEFDEEERAIAAKGFYLHPNPFTGSDPPELLPLFPLHSPTHRY